MHQAERRKELHLHSAPHIVPSVVCHRDSSVCAPQNTVTQMRARAHTRITCTIHTSEWNETILFAVCSSIASHRRNILCAAFVFIRCSFRLTGTIQLAIGIGQTKMLWFAFASNLFVGCECVYAYVPTFSSPSLSAADFLFLFFGTVASLQLINVSLSGIWADRARKTVPAFIIYFYRLRLSVRQRFFYRFCFYERPKHRFCRWIIIGIHYYVLCFFFCISKRVQKLKFCSDKETEKSGNKQFHKINTQNECNQIL